MNSLSVPSGLAGPSPGPRRYTQAGQNGDEFIQQRRQSATLEDHYHTEEPHFHYPQKQRSWHPQPRSPGLKWYKDYSQDQKKHGRVLLIDYVKQNSRKDGTQKVAAQEIDNVEGLRRFYAHPDRCNEAVLRVFHVQNASWATHFLLQKFNINARDDLVGTDFDKYVSYKRPEQRGGKPFLSGKTWETQHDPWRGISRTAFGIDYLKPYEAQNPAAQVERDASDRMMELNCYSENDDPIYAYDIYVQRLSCYIQRKEANPEVPTTPGIESPYADDNNSQGYGNKRSRPRLDMLDNGNTIIIFENSHSRSIEDTMISARQEWESRWRRLPFYLAYESQDVSNDDHLALECMAMVLQDVWKSVAETWEKFLDLCNTHVSILEDKIYEMPADESRAPELWINSSMWLKVERLMLIHTDIVRECQSNLGELTDEPNMMGKWLESTPNDFERLGNLVQEDLVKPAAALSDLMYKSVGIRDSRHSLQLSMSMWRLSWITFIFLPLTFIVGFFGMNVDAFANNPSLKWYFISAVPLMLTVMVSWYVLKHYLERSRQTPFSRGIYEQLFHELATTHPQLWSRSGPRDYVRPRGRFSQWKWWLIIRWSEPAKTVKAGVSDGDDQFDGLGTWSHFKRYLLRRWTSQIYTQDTIDALNHSLESVDGTGLLTDAVARVTELNDIPSITKTPDLEAGMTKFSHIARLTKPLSPEIAARPSSRGSSAGRNSGVMVEEERPSWLQDYSEKRHRWPSWMGAEGATRSEGKENRRSLSGASLSKSDRSNEGNPGYRKDNKNQAQPAEHE